MMKIRYYGHCGQLTGYGRAAEQMCHALLAAGAELEIRTLAPYDSLKFETDGGILLETMLRTDAQLDPRPDVVIVHTLPMDCPKVVELAVPTLISSLRPRPIWVAYTTWEAVGEAPLHVVKPYEVFDEVWHPSASSSCAFEALMAQDHGGNVRVMPHCFDEDTLPYCRERVHPPGATAPRVPYRFYSVGAFSARKNPVALVRAFAHAFTRDDDVELLLACQGLTAEILTHTICATGIPPNELPPIRCDFRALTEGELWNLHRGADCFVTATRGEAWNLPAFEAVLAGRHVIAPLGHGHQTFLHRTSAMLYGSYPMPAMVETRAVRDGSGFHVQTIGAQGLTSKSIWLEPDVLQLAEAMRASYEQRISNLDVQYDLAERFGYKAVGTLAMSALENLLALRKDRP